MLSAKAALARCLQATLPVLAERVSLDLAFDRVLAEPIVSPLNVPPWDNSAMDGYAVRACDVQQSGVTLRVLETIAAGAVPKNEVVEGTCARIMTGAPIPRGADTVIMVERTSTSEDMRSVTLHERPSPGQNVRPLGGDVRKGQRVLEPGTVLTPAAVALISSLGIPSVLVAQKPRVAILSTGDEVVPPGFPKTAGQIYGSNTLALIGLVRQAGAEPVHCGIAPDDPQGLRDALQRCLRCDLILTTGGVSVGDFDHVKDVMGGVDFWKVAIKPGKPLAFGDLEGVPFFGLPGNPVSCMVNFLQFVRPVIRQSLGDPKPYLPVVPATLTHPLRKKPGRAHLSRVMLRRDGQRWLATPTATQSSGVLMTMVLADGLTLLPPDAGDQPEGAELLVQLIRPDWGRAEDPQYPWDHDPLHDHGC
ncbi:MAG: gephyrin-like molybdotransferase Glp [Myxococcota bacterium]|nr:gephyrin-like molybdotransferase Glp [Myxococcota bacterium]